MRMKKLQLKEEKLLQLKKQQQNKNFLTLNKLTCHFFGRFFCFR
jgi:hypothetical protein